MQFSGARARVLCASQAGPDSSPNKVGSECARVNGSWGGHDVRALFKSYWEPILFDFLFKYFGAVASGHTSLLPSPFNP